MKIINVNNVVLQFDLEDDIEITEEMINSQIEAINTFLSDQFSWSQPQLVVSSDKEINVIEF